MNLLVAENIEKKYANHLALDNVSISVPKGNIFGLLGPNGAGKTTLIRIINQITAPDKGNIYINGEKLCHKHIENIGYLPEERGLYKKMKVGEQALYLCQLKGLSKSQALRELKKWFEKLEIQSWWDKKVEELSKGMQQKVQFIITILHKPDLLIFDEPFSGFDPINTNMLKQEILKLKEEGATIIFSTHNMASVEEICDNIALINKSKKILDGSIDSIKKQYDTNIYEIEYAENFIKPDMNVCPDFKIFDINTSKNTNSLKVQITNNEINSNEMLQQMLQYGSIVGFNKHLPNMNEIFIRVVGEMNYESK